MRRKSTRTGRCDATLTAPQMYERVLVFLDELVRDSGELPSPLRGRLDAYALPQVVVTLLGKPESWAPDIPRDEFPPPSDRLPRAGCWAAGAGFPL